MENRKLCPKCPQGTVVVCTFFSHLKLGMTKDLTKPIMMQLDNASTCKTLPEKLAQSLIPRGQNITNYIIPSNSKLAPVGKLELPAESTAGYHLHIFHVLKDSHIQGKPLLLLGSDYVKLGMAKIRSDEIHSFGTSCGNATLQKPHPKPPKQLPTLENLRARDIPRLPEPIPARRMLDVPHQNTSLHSCLRIS